ncbi:carbamoyl-phosphate synthase (glutamine-hydrolyzing) cpa2, partial [Coemansia sp. RSA 1285]
SGIDLVVSLARRRPESKADAAYAVRRMAVDFGIPLVNDPRCAEMLVDALAALPAGWAQRSLATPLEARPWRQYLDQRTGASS